MTKKLESVNWEECLKLSNSKPEVAKELLAMFADELPKLQSEMKKAYQQNNFQQLKDQAHKLHGACCYAGVPLLKQMVGQLESQLQSPNNQKIETLLRKIDNEAAFVLNSLKQIPMSLP